MGLLSDPPTGVKSHRRARLRPERELLALPMPLGPAVFDLLPTLQRALTGDGPAVLPVPAADPVVADRLATDLGAGTPLGTDEDDPDDPTAFVVGTSGSTGPIKGVLLTATALRASAGATRDHLTARLSHPIPHGQRSGGGWLLALPPHHIAGLQVMLRSLADGSSLTVLAPPFRAEGFVRAVARMPAGPRWTSLVPTQLRRLLADPAATAALAELDAVLVGGAALPDDLRAAAVASAIPLIGTYGMSETCGGCVYDGRPLDRVHVSVDATSGPGRITVAGPVVARGHRARIGAMPDEDPEFGYDAAGLRSFRTGDLGEFVDGRLRVWGRIDDLIITGGVKVDPAMVERALLALPGVDEVVVTGVADAEWGQAVVAVLATTDAGTSLLPDVRAAARNYLGAAAVPKHVLTTPHIPRIGPGKPDRAAVRRWAESQLAGRVKPGSRSRPR